LQLPPQRLAIDARHLETASLSESGGMTHDDIA
jgi:hypothetical protein